jgi:hypothetical protein
MTTLFRPVGFHELALIWDSQMREFPPRLPHQPIFYPVANIEYATQIARDWNTRDEASGFSEFVTQFAVPESYLNRFEPRTVGSSSHLEYWVPAEELATFNASIQGVIGVEAAYFGEAFGGYIPERFGLKDRDVTQQFVAMCKTWDYSRMDFVCEVSTNRKAVYLNFLFWAQFDFTGRGVEQQQRDEIIKKLAEAWEFNHIEVPLPLVAIDNHTSL